MDHGADLAIQDVLPGPDIDLTRGPAPAACQEHGRWACEEVQCLVPHVVIDLR